MAPLRILSDFDMRRPPFEVPQERMLAWLLDAHVEAERVLAHMDDAQTAHFRHRMQKVVGRAACNPSQIHARGYTLEDPTLLYDTAHEPHGKGTDARMQIFEREARRYFDEAYRDVTTPPDDIVHVTCTGYVSPSAPQHLVAERGWGERTRVTHAYHMGCYAAIPALRVADGCLDTSAAEKPRADIVHTELCTLHLDPGRQDLEQLVVHSLFADGVIKYSMQDDDGRPGLAILATSEHIIPDSEDSMRWVISEHGMEMTLSRDVPDKVGGALRGFVTDLLAQASLSLRDLPRLQFAVHPGGPRIIDGVREALELDEAQVHVSREVLYDYGNMSSATLPHVWMRMLASDDVARGTNIISLAFGPGLTVCGVVLRKQ